MKKKFIIFLIILGILILSLIPMPRFYKDGGTIEYSAVLWGVTKHHSIAERDGVYGIETGTTVRVLQFDVYSDFPNEFIPD